MRHIVVYVQYVIDSISMVNFHGDQWVSYP